MNFIGFLGGSILDSTQINTIAWLLIAACNLITAFLSFRTNQAAVSTQANMAKVEIATNSMKDALVTATAKASYAEGHTVGTAEGESKAATLAEGRLAASNEASM